MLTEALPLAAAGSIYPVAFAAIVAMLGGANPMRRALFFLLGGLIVSFIGYVVVVTLIRRSTSLLVSIRRWPRR